MGSPVVGLRFFFVFQRSKERITAPGAVVQSTVLDFWKVAVVVEQRRRRSDSVPEGYLHA